MFESVGVQRVQQEELMEYMKAVIDVETELLTQEKILVQCESEINSRKPVLQLEPEPKMPQVQSSNEKSGASTIYNVSGGIFLFFVLIGFAYHISVVIISLLLSLGFFAAGLVNKKSANDIQSANMNDQIYYEKKRKAVAEVNQQRRAAYSEALGDCRRSIESIRESMRPHMEETKSLLEKLYSKGIIYPKYCTLPALTSIYEYFLTGRCTELTGPHGAYNLYEDELRKDTVISQLNVVIDNLEQIRQNQFMLYQQVKAIQENTAEIASELRQIKGYTVQIAQMSALNAYYAALTERNTRLTMYYHL